MDTFGQPTFIGAIIVDDGQALVFIGYATWGGLFEALSNNSQLYANVLQVYAFDLTQYNVSLKIAMKIDGATSTTRVTLVPGGTEQANIQLPDHQSWTTIIATIGGVEQTYSYATPISLLPPSIENVGGLDLMVLIVISEMVIVAGASIALAKKFMQRALWAPPFSLLIWGHVVLVSIAAAVLIDYQWVDMTFAGWSPLVYAGCVAPMLFLSMLSFFNKAPSALILRANTPLAGRLSYHVWWIDVAQDPKGNECLIQPTTGGMLARYFGHYTPFTANEDIVTKPEPFVADLIQQKLLSRQEILRRVRRPSPAKSNPLDDFVAIPAQLTVKPDKHHNMPSRLYWTPTGMPIDVEWPHLSFHRDVDVPARINEAGTVVVPAHTEHKLAWPHYTEGKAKLTLASIHFRSVQSVVSGWRSIEDLVKVLTDTSFDLDMLKSTFDTVLAAKLRERLLAREAALGRTAEDLTEQEAVLEAERTRGDMPNLEELYGRDVVTRPLTTRRPKAP